MQPKEETDVLLITTRCYFKTRMYIHFSKIPSLCREIADVGEHEEDGGHNSR